MAVKRAPDAETGLIQDVGVNHGRRHVFVAEELLHGANIGPAFEQMHSEAVPEGVAAGRFWDAGFPHSDFNCILQVLLLDMVPA